MKRLAIEFVIIVAGVLFAFWIDSSWEQVQQDNRRDEFLSAVLAELDVNHQRINERIASEAEVSAAIAKLLAIRATPEAKIDPELVELVWLATSFRDVQIADSSLSSLEQSTVWAELDDPNLQLLLSDFNTSIDAMASFADTRRSHYLNVAEPYLRTRISYTAWEDRRVLPDDDWAMILADKEFENILVHMNWFGRSVRRSMELASSQAEQLKSQIHAYMQAR